MHGDIITGATRRPCAPAMRTRHLLLLPSPPCDEPPFVVRHHATRHARPRRPPRSRTGPSSKTRPCATSRRCCASTPATRREARSRRPTTSSRCSTRKASRRRCFALEPHRPNVVARLKGNGSKRPLLLMAHTDVVNVDPKKWTHPPFSATREGGYVYARGTVDDKDNVTAVLMALLMLEAAERAARPRRHRAVRSRRRRAPRASASSSWPISTSPPSTPSSAYAEGGGVTRQGGPGEVRVGADAGEDPARDPAHRARRRRATARCRCRPTRSCTCPTPSPRSASGSRRSGQTRPRARTSSGWRRSRRRKKPSAIAMRSAPTRR